LKEHFRIVIVPNDHEYAKRIDPGTKKVLEFEREKLRKLKEVYQVGVDLNKNCMFFLRDFIEYVRKVLQLQRNVSKLS